MRKDVKTGMLIGSVVCIGAVIWFCIEQNAYTVPVVAEPNTTPGEAGQYQRQRQIDSRLASEPTKPLKQQSRPSDGPVPQPQLSSVPAKQVIHIVGAGQTLSDISRIYYGTTRMWKKIYNANKDKFPRGPDSIKAGTKLIIPE